MYTAPFKYPRLFTHLFIHLSIHLHVYPFIYLSNSSIHPSNVYQVSTMSWTLGYIVGKADIDFTLVKLALQQLYTVFMEFSRITFVYFIKTAKKKTCISLKHIHTPSSSLIQQLDCNCNAQVHFFSSGFIFLKAFSMYVG